MSKFLKMQLDLLRAPNLKNLKLRDTEQVENSIPFYF